MTSPWLTPHCSEKVACQHCLAAKVVTVQMINVFLFCFDNQPGSTSWCCSTGTYSNKCLRIRRQWPLGPSKNADCLRPVSAAPLGTGFAEPLQGAKQLSDGRLDVHSRCRSSQCSCRWSWHYPLPSNLRHSCIGFICIGSSKTVGVVPSEALLVTELWTNNPLGWTISNLSPFYAHCVIARSKHDHCTSRQIYFLQASSAAGVTCNARQPCMPNIRQAIPHVTSN